jgi:hypothetical protein
MRPIARSREAKVNGTAFVDAAPVDRTVGVFAARLDQGGSAARAKRQWATAAAELATRVPSLTATSASWPDSLAAGQLVVAGQAVWRSWPR